MTQGKRLEGKVALITGGASGIGEGSVHSFISEGASVMIADIRAAAAADLASNIGRQARGIRCDVTVESEIADAVTQTVEEFGRLDIMFNNAGIIGAVGSITQTSDEDWQRSLAILLNGPFYGIKHAAKGMVEQKNGSIISTASTAGFAGGLGPHAYTTAKHAIIGLTKSAASELAKHGVRVNAIAPGNTATAMTAGTPEDEKYQTVLKAMKASSPLGIAGMPEDIAQAAIYLASDESRYMSGHTMLVDGGQLAGAGTGAFHDKESNMITGVAGKS